MNWLKQNGAGCGIVLLVLAITVFAVATEVSRGITWMKWAWS